MNINKKNNLAELSFQNIDFEDLHKELFYYIRVAGIKYNGFNLPIEETYNTQPIYERIYSVDSRGESRPTQTKYCVDIKEILGYDRAARLIAMLFLKKIVDEKPRPQIILGLETTGFSITSAIITLHDLFFPNEKLEACYVRKKKKASDLGLWIEGARNYAGKRAVFVDDFMNSGQTFSNMVIIARETGVLLQKGIFVIKQDEEKKNIDTEVPAEGLFMMSQIRDPKILVKKEGHKYLFEENALRNQPIVKKETKDPLWQIDLIGEAENKTLAREDIELVRLAKDTAITSVASGHEERPLLKYDGRGSYGYLPFLGKYLKEEKTVVVKINKREFKDGKWINRQRGCAIWGQENSTAQNVIGATAGACKKSLRLDMGCPRGPFHKPVWLEELGSLSFFVFVEEKREWIGIENLNKIKLADNEGLLVRKDGFLKIVFDDLREIVRMENATEILFSNLANREGELKNFTIEDGVEIMRISGRWLWLPERPKKYFFNHAYRK